MLVFGAALLVALMRLMRLPEKKRPALFRREKVVLVMIVIVIAAIMGGLVMIFAGVPPENRSFEP